MSSPWHTWREAAAWTINGENWGGHVWRDNSGWHWELSAPNGSVADAGASTSQHGARSAVRRRIRQIESGMLVMVPKDSSLGEGS